MCDVFDETGVGLSRHFAIYLNILYIDIIKRIRRKEKKERKPTKERKKRKDKLCLYSIVLSSVCKHKNQNIQKKFIF